jgi:hypothetical protein
MGMDGSGSVAASINSILTIKFGALGDVAQ